MTTLYDLMMKRKEARSKVTKELFGDAMHDMMCSEKTRSNILKALDDAGGYENLPSDPNYVKGEHNWRVGWETV